VVSLYTCGTSQPQGTQSYGLTVWMLSQVSDIISTICQESDALQVIINHDYILTSICIVLFKWRSIWPILQDKSLFKHVNSNCQFNHSVTWMLNVTWCSMSRRNEKAECDMMCCYDFWCYSRLFSICEYVWYMAAYCGLRFQWALLSCLAGDTWLYMYSWRQVTWYFRFSHVISYD